MRHIRWANNKAHPVSSWGCATDPNSDIMSQNGHGKSAKFCGGGEGDFNITSKTIYCKIHIGFATVVIQNNVLRSFLQISTWMYDRALLGFF